MRSSFNVLIFRIGFYNSTFQYHDNEDRLAEYVKKSLSGRFTKKETRWLGMDIFNT